MEYYFMQGRIQEGQGTVVLVKNTVHLHSSLKIEIMLVIDFMQKKIMLICNMNMYILIWLMSSSLIKKNMF